METSKSFEGQQTKLIESEQVPHGQENLVPTNETKMEDPQQIKSCRRRKRTFEHAKKIETPTEMPTDMRNG